MTEKPQPSERVIVKSAAWYTISVFLTKSLGFITIPLFTRLMTQSEFGTFNAFSAIQILVIAFFGLESHLTINRARFDYNERELKSYQLSILTLSALLSASLLIALLSFPRFFEGLTSIDRQYLLIMAIYVMFYPSFNMFQSYQRVQYKFKLSASLSFAVSLTATAISVVLVVSLSDALMGRIAGYYVPFAIVGACFYVYYWWCGKRIRLTHWKYAIKLCIPLVISTVGAHGLTVSSRIVVQQIDSPTATALVALASTMTSIGLILITAISHAWSPWLMDCLERQEFQRARRSFIPILGIVTALCLAAALLAPEAIAILGGAEYSATVPLVPSFMAVALFSLIAAQYIFVQTYYKSISSGGIATLAAATLNVFLLIVGVQAIGHESAGYIVMFSYLVLIIAHKVSMRRLQLPDIFPWTLIGVPLALSIAVIPLSLWLFNSELVWVRYACVAAVAASGVPFGFRVVRQRRASHR